MDPAGAECTAPAQEFPGHSLRLRAFEQSEGKGWEGSGAFSVEAAQVVIVALEKVSFERLLCNLVMTLLKSDGSTTDGVELKKGRRT